MSGAGLDRRLFLKAAAVAAGASPWSRIASANEASVSPSAKRIDVNVNLLHWPCRRVPNDDTPALVARLRRGGVTQAWAGGFDGLLHKNIAAANARLAKECRARGDGLLIPFGTVNPMAPDWEEDLRRCVEQFNMPGIRLHPNYHGYKLNDPLFARLLELAAERRLIVQLALCMEDERMMHPLLRVSEVDPSPLGDLVNRIDGLRLVLLNVKTAGVELLARIARDTEQATTGVPLLRRSSEADSLAGTACDQAVAHRSVKSEPAAQSEGAEVCMDIAMIEGVAGVERLLDKIPLSRLCFGSHAPLFYFESALLKLKESVLSDEQIRAIQSQNAERLLSSRNPLWL